MKGQYDFYKGTIRIRIKGALVEPYLQACTRRGCQVTHLKRTSEDEVQLTIRLSDWRIFRELRKKYRCKIFLVEGQGIPFIVKRMFQRTSLLIAFFVGVVFVFVLANTLWSIEVKGLNPELEASVESKLKSYGVTPGKLTIGMSDPNDIQRKLLEDIPDLLWVGVKKQGTSYHLYGVEKIRHDTDDKERPTYLVAKKKGMIVQSFIKTGRPLVSVYDVVQKGQPLATGELVEDGDVFVHAEGEVIAETWYKVEQTLPQKHILQLTNGEATHSYSLDIGRLRVPLWGWWTSNEGDIREESETSDWSVFGWQLPVQMQTTSAYSLDAISLENSQKELKEIGVRTAKESLRQTLDERADILDEKVLHLSKEHGKVKLILLFKVYEDIAETKYISQGD